MFKGHAGPERSEPDVDPNAGCVPGRAADQPGRAADQLVPPFNGVEVDTTRHRLVGVRYEPNLL